MLLARGMAGLIKISEDNKYVADVSWSEKKKDKQKYNYIISNCYLLWITSFIVIYCECNIMFSYWLRKFHMTF